LLHKVTAATSRTAVSAAFYLLAVLARAVFRVVFNAHVLGADVASPLLVTSRCGFYRVTSS